MGKVLIVSGMHRSGTSLTANWLAQCGLFVGEDLIPADTTNPKGHFEDRDISHFQRRILEDNGLNHLVLPGDEITISENHFDEARELIGRYADHKQWGWKDPRTALLLNFWKTLLPEAKFLFVFRAPQLVVDSLVRRDSKQYGSWKERIFQVVSLQKRINRYLGVWQRYNADILSFASKNPDCSLIVDVDDLLHQDNLLLNFINREWYFDLVYKPINDIYDSNLLTKNVSPIVMPFMQAAPDQITDTYRELRKQSTLSFDKLSTENRM